MYLGQIAEYIWDSELDDGTIATPEVIQAEKQKIADILAVNIGQLNVYLNSEFSVADEETDIPAGTNGWINGGKTRIVTPELLQEETLILIQMYLRDYYRKKSRTVLNSTVSTDVDAATGSVSEWTELREGDSVIKRVATVASPAQKTAASKSFENLSAVAGAELNELIQRYNLYLSKPRQVIAKGTSSTPKDV